MLANHASSPWAIIRVLLDRSGIALDDVLPPGWKDINTYAKGSRAANLGSPRKGCTAVWETTSAPLSPPFHDRKKGCEEFLMGCHRNSLDNSTIPIILGNGPMVDS